MKYFKIEQTHFNVFFASYQLPIKMKQTDPNNPKTPNPTTTVSRMPPLYLALAKIFLDNTNIICWRTGILVCFLKIGSRAVVF
jgi:hypothetical protein